MTALASARTFSPAVLTTLEDLRTFRAQGAGRETGFVPTMGALHAGHMELVRTARASCERVLVSIFVNDKQFSPGEDFATYPRTAEADLALCAAAGVDAVFMPSREIMYPAGFDTRVRIEGLDKILTGASRPDFFSGIATVVARLLMLAGAQQAFFGEKDYQQLQVIRRLTEDLAVPVRIIGVPVVREADGLALSSRNVYLSAEERRQAPALYEALCQARDAVRSGMAVSAAEAGGEAFLLSRGFHKVDFFKVLMADDLTRPYDPSAGKPGRILSDAWLGRTRLVDNIEL